MIHIVTALDCEARPLIDHFKLKRCQLFKPFPLYMGGNIKLVVCGIGAHNAIIACAALGGFNSGESIASDKIVTETAWFNIGVGGHLQADVGQPFLAHKVSEVSVQQSKTKSFYPCWIGKWPCQSANIVTVSEPVTDYQPETIYDMEASGFCEAAYRFSTIELVQVLKIISDNNTQSIDLVNKELVIGLLMDQIDLISSIVSTMQDTALEIERLSDKPDNFEYLLNYYRVSVSNQVQLKHLLRRWQLLESGSVLDSVSVEKHKSIKFWMNAVSDKLSHSPVIFSAP